jgi:hypothetical protein
MASDTQERLRRLAERAQGPDPETWRPDQPDVRHPNPLAGLVVRIKAGPVHPEYGPSQIAEIQDANDQMWDVFLFGRMLSEAFDQTQVGAYRPGDLVAIHFLGKQPKKHAAGTYNSYRVVGEPADPSAAQPPAFGERPSGAAPLEQPHEPSPSPYVPPWPDPEPIVVAERAARSAAAEAAAAEPVVCEACLMANGFHKAGCPKEDEIPF